MVLRSSVDSKAIDKGGKPWDVLSESWAGALDFGRSNTQGCFISFPLEGGTERKRVERLARSARWMVWSLPVFNEITD